MNKGNCENRSNQDITVKARLVVTLLLYCFSSICFSEEFIKQIDCLNKDSINLSEREHIKCLEKRLNEMIVTVNSIMKVTVGAKDIQLKDVKKINSKLIPPPRNVQQQPAVETAITVSYWSHGNESLSTPCVPGPTPPPGYVTYGMTLSEQLDPIGHGCKPAGHCDSHGEHCMRRARSAGCYVNKDWYDWYVDWAEKLRLPIDYHHVCEN